MWKPLPSQTRLTCRRPRNPRARCASLGRLEERQLLAHSDFELSKLLVRQPSRPSIGAARSMSLV